MSNPGTIQPSLDYMLQKGYLPTAYGAVAVTLYAPTSHTKDICFLFCPVYHDELDAVNPLYTTMAQRMAALGWPVLLFDFPGVGDSEGTDYLNTIHDDMVVLEHIAAYATGELKARTCGILGLRWGATRALHAACRGIISGPLILWNIILDSRRYLDILVRKRISMDFLVKVTATRHSKEGLHLWLSEYIEKGYLEESIDPVAQSPVTHKEQPETLDLCGFMVHKHQISDFQSHTVAMPLQYQSPVFMLQWGTGTTKNHEYAKLFQHLQAQNTPVVCEYIHCSSHWSRHDGGDIETPVVATTNWLRRVVK